MLDISRFGLGYDAFGSQVSGAQAMIVTIELDPTKEMPSPYTGAFTLGDAA